MTVIKPNLGQIIDKHNRRTKRAVTGDGIVISRSGRHVKVRYMGGIITAENTSGQMVGKGDVVALARERKLWMITAVIARDNITNPSQMGSPGGGQVQPISNAGTAGQAVLVSAVSVWTEHPAAIEFTTLRDRALVGGYLRCQFGGVVPIDAVFYIRAKIDGGAQYSDTVVFVENRNVLYDVSHHSTHHFVMPITGLTPGAHTFQFEALIGSITTNGYIYLINSSMWAVGL